MHTCACFFIHPILYFFFLCVAEENQLYRECAKFQSSSKKLKGKIDQKSTTV